MATEAGTETDAGKAKKELRERIWSALRELGAARFPGARHRIPNFTGAEAAAVRLAETPRFRRAGVLKSNPDLPQRPVRHLALQAGKRVYLAAPRLAADKPFVLLDPARLPPDRLWHASSIRGAMELGRPVSIRQMRPIDLIVTGCVGVGTDGARLGKGGGYADLEYAILREAELIGPRTPILTTVHGVQVCEAGVVPMRPHDTSLDGYATAEGFERCPRRYRRPRGVLWDELGSEKRAAIPILARGRLRKG